MAQQIPTPMSFSQSIQFFAKLGAVKYGHPSLTARRYYGDSYHYENTDFAYFFDDQGREVGYWTVMSEWFGPMVFAPNYRQWDKMFIDDLTFHPIHNRPERIYALEEAVQGINSEDPGGSQGLCRPGEGQRCDA